MIELANKNLENYALIIKQKHARLCSNYQTKAYIIKILLINKSVEDYVLISKQKRSRLWYH